MKTISLKTISKSLIVVILIGTTSLFSQNNNFEISKNLDIYATLYKELNINYVDDINPGELMETGIDAILKSLDPYTVFIPEAEIEDFKFITTGQYGGVGALIHKQNDYIVISEPYEGKPAQKSGLLAGDKIIEIEGKSAVGKSTSDISAILKGQPGTNVKLLIKRDGIEEPFEKELLRENVKIENIPYYGIIGENIAYIKLMGFTQKAGKEVKEAFLELKKSHELKGVILDLRGNGGGLLQEAVNITNIFVEKDQLVVKTKGKLPNKNHSYKTMNPVVDKEIPLVVIVDHASASASEIVAGALQDLDRGVVVGQRTFGKGLVQNVIPLAYNSQAKITVAKYYIPSGRCIQEIDYSVKDGNGNSGKIPDSLISTFKTKNGRLVYDGKGIEPDIHTDGHKLSNISYSLLTKFLFFDYATKFAAENEQIAPSEDFKITDEIFVDFISFISDKDYHYTTKCEKTLESLQSYAEEEGYFESISTEFENLSVKMEENKKGDIKKHEDEIKRILRIEIISRYYYQKGKILSSLIDDVEIASAIEIINEKDDYAAILDGTNTN